MRRVAVLFSFAFPFALLACGNEGHGDADSNLGVPPPNGKDQHISDIGDPNSPNHAGYLVSGNTVNVSGAIVSNVDNFDETGDGKSKGTIYVQDLGSKAPYAGSSLFSPSFVPGDLHVSALDVLDLSGQYVEEQNIGSAVFATGAFLEQFSKPVATFRFEVSQPPDPVDIDIMDLADYTTGRKWMNMVVRVHDVTVQDDVSSANVSSGRLSIGLLAATKAGGTKCSDPFPKPPTLTNELFDAASLDIPKDTKLKSVTGVVTYFCNIHLSPRSANDIEK